MHAGERPADERSGDGPPVMERGELVCRWLRDVLGSAEPLEVAEFSEDASLRRYLRVRAGTKDYVVMDAPVAGSGLESWVDVRARLAAAGLRVPELHAADIERGLLLISDLGNRHYLEELDSVRADELYADAVSALGVMQSRVSFDGLPIYDAAFLRRELDLFEGWFLYRHLGIRLTGGQRGALGKSFDRLIAAAIEQEQVFVHRDYHSRNLMVCAGGTPGILDFQDAVRGPIAYDVVSLFRDVYVSWPDERVDAWVGGAHEALRRAGRLGGVPLRRFRRWVDFCGVQRHLKIAGVFARLFHRDAKSRYLADIPLTLSYLRTVSERYSSLCAIPALLDELDIPERLALRNAGIGSGGGRVEVPR